MTGMEHWPRWFFASITKHFKDILGPDIDVYIEGTDREPSLRRNLDYVEIRMDGPRVRQTSHNVYRIDVVINVLIHSVMDQKDSHRIYKSEGLVLAAFTTIPIRKYGDTVDDTGDLLVCIGVRDNFDIKVSQFGQIDPTVRRMQSMVEAPYRTEIYS